MNVLFNVNFYGNVIQTYSFTAFGSSYNLYCIVILLLSKHSLFILKLVEYCSNIMCFQDKFLRFLELHNDIYFVSENTLRVLLACFRTLLVITPCQESSSVIYSEVKNMIYKLCDSNWKSQIFKATWRSTIQGDHIPGKYVHLSIITILKFTVGQKQNINSYHHLLTDCSNKQQSINSIHQNENLLWSCIGDSLHMVCCTRW